jgi:spore germination cell wall hydrolase CwlJ-like protein
LDPIELLYALCVWREASGEGIEGMRAVAWIIWNRHKRWDKTLHDVIMAPFQFTSMSVDEHPREPEPDDQQMAEAKVIIGDIINNRDTVDPTHGALYYANLAVVRAANEAHGLPREAGWFFRHIVNDPVNHPQLAHIGEHTFYK